MEKIGFRDLTFPACGLLPSFSPVTHSLAPRLVSCQLPPTPFPIPSLKSGPESSNWPRIRGNKVGPTPIHPFLSPTTSRTLHTATPLFSVQADCGKQCDQRPLTTGNGKLTCKNSASSFLTLKITLKCFFLGFASPSSLHLLMFLSSYGSPFLPKTHSPLLFLSSTSSRPGTSTASNQWRRGATAAAGPGYEPRRK